MLTVLLPVTRAWTRQEVIDHIAASDMPRDRCVVILDAPGCEEWIPSLEALGFAVAAHETGNDHPPAGRAERRARHRAMRRLSQSLVPDGPLLCIEDDVLVCPDIYARLSAVGGNATGVVIARHASRIPVIYPLRSRMGTGVESITGCGYNCLLTTGEAYKAAEVRDDGGAPDFEHTSQIRPLKVDWGCVCGHMTETGVLWPEGR